MRAYRAVAGGGADSIELVERDRPPLGANAVRVALEAASLNKRDEWIIEGKYSVPEGSEITPLSDACGTVIEIGSAVSRVSTGDRVLPTFFPGWIEGPISAEKTRSSYGVDMHGMLAEEVVIEEQALVQAPGTWSSADASTLPCAALTAWNAIFVRGGLKAGDTVLLLGTGGVSIWALQFASAAGVRAIITSSSDEKLARARELGATEVVNYRRHPEWQDEVRRLTDGLGVDCVIEVGGAGTMPRSIASVRTGGTVVVIGGVAGPGDGIDPRALIDGAVTLAGMMVGSRTMLEEVVAFVEEKNIRPIIDRRFTFEEAADAYRHLVSGAHLGKVVIDITRATQIGGSSA